MIFTRERTDKTNEWDYIAGAWECIPSKPEIPVTKRAEFCHASWSADPLLGVLVWDDSYGYYPRFVRLQVDAKTNLYTVNLYDINYRTWDVRCIWQGDRLSAFGVIRDLAFCKDYRDWFTINVASGKISKELPFIPLDVDKEFWLVRKPGEESGCWSFDRGTGNFVGHFGQVDEPESGDTRALLSVDGKDRAWVIVPVPNDNWDGGVVNGTFVLQREGHAEDVRVTVKLFATPGSSRALIPIDTDLRFTDDRKVEFSARREMDSHDVRVWTIDIASGKVTESVRPYVAPKEETRTSIGCVPAPEYLRPHLKDFEHFGRGGLAPAFLRHLGVLQDKPGYSDCTAAVSPDGRRILYKGKQGPLANVIIYGDLKTKQTVRWACPVELKNDNALEFVWVETP